MPELPEVENTVRSLNNLICGKKIKNVWISELKLVKKISIENFKKNIKNKKIVSIQRRAKNIIIFFDKNYAMLIHLKMTGHLLIGKWNIKKDNKLKKFAVPVNKGVLSDKVNGYIHVIFYLSNGQELALSDMRKFAKIIFGKKEDVLKENGVYNAGKEALEIKLNEFADIVLRSFKNIKTLLMDQKKIAGIGNIYSDDILFKAKIHPLRRSNSLTLKEIKILHKAIKDILLFAIKEGGTSISDYRDISGEKGKYGDKRLIYKRDGSSCLECGSSIKRIKINGRSSRFCPVCQK